MSGELRPKLKLTLGQKLVVRHGGRYPAPDAEIEVIRIGRKYAYLQREGGWNEVKISLATTFGRIGLNDRLALPEIDEYHARVTEAKERLVRYGFIRHVTDWLSNVHDADLFAVSDLLEKLHGDSPED